MCPAHDPAHSGAGPQARPHYHPVDPATGQRNGGHVFYSVGGVPSASSSSEGTSDFLMDAFEFLSPILPIGDALKPYLPSTGEPNAG